MKSIMRHLFVVCLALTTAGALAQDHKDIIKSVHTVRGQFVGFESGDYMHAIIKNAKGKEVSYFIGEPGLEYFLACYPNRKGAFKTRTVDTFIKEAGGRMVIDRVHGATIAGKTYLRWWRELRRKMSQEEIDKKYEPLVQKLTRNN